MDVVKAIPKVKNKIPSISRNFSPGPFARILDMLPLGFTHNILDHIQERFGILGRFG